MDQTNNYAQAPSSSAQAGLTSRMRSRVNASQNGVPAAGHSKAYTNPYPKPNQRTNATTLNQRRTNAPSLVSSSRTSASSSGAVALDMSDMAKKRSYAPSSYEAQSSYNRPLIKNLRTSRSTNKDKMTRDFDYFAAGLGIMAIITIVLALCVMRGLGLLVLVFVLMVCIGSFWFASYLVHYIMEKDDGTPEMRVVSDAIREGAQSYLKTQYGAIASVACITIVGLILVYVFRPNTTEVSNTVVGLVTAVSFALGAFCSALAGYSGVWVSVRVNIRVAAAAAKYSFSDALLLSFRGGAVSSVLSASMCILGISFMYVLGQLIFVSWLGINANELPMLLGGYGFGASFVALFMQLGGGIYTKAADVGADMCGKIEQGIPEDDPRNPAVVADLVGDNVGDCAGSMADVFESIAGEMIGTMILGADLAAKANMESAEMFVFFPLIIHSLDLIVSSCGIMATYSKNDKEDPLTSMKRGYLVALGMAVVLFVIVTRLMLYSPASPSSWWHYTLCGFIGLVTAYLLVLITQYYTDYNYGPVKKIRDASSTGHGTNIIAGVAVGMESTALPVIVIAIALLSSYKLGSTTNLNPSNPECAHVAGLFGTAVATMGMLCTAVFVLSMNNFGPIADNAGGCVEMSEQPQGVRDITDKLDAVGNVTKAATKGYAVGGSALACFLLFQAYLDEISMLTKKPIDTVNITKVEVLVAGLLGIMMIFLFTGWAMDAVGTTAMAVVREVRRQFKDMPGIMDYKQKPEYGTCVAIVTKSALRQMFRPALLALLMPVFVGVLFRYIGQYQNDPMLGVECLASFLMFGSMVGLVMAIFLDNSGGAWDNAKKLIEATGVKGSEEHKAAITGDTVGDPFKDTAGPSLHVIITTMSTTALVLGPLFVGNLGDGDG